MSEKNEFSTAIEFPCDFTIKVMGEATDTFEEKVLEIVSRYIQESNIKSTSKRQSKNGTYLSVTVTIFAESKEQLDSIYIDLSKDPDIVMAL